MPYKDLRFANVPDNVVNESFSTAHVENFAEKLAALTKVVLVSRVHPFNLPRERVTVPCRSYIRISIYFLARRWYN